MRKLIFVSVVASLLVAIPLRDAAACLCDGGTQLQLTYPEDGKTGVATNTIVLFVESEPSSRAISLRAQGALEDLAVEAMRWSDVIASASEEWTQLTAVAELAPETAYEVVSDGEVVSTFITGTDRDDSPPLFPGLVDVELSRIPGNGCDCWERDVLDQIRLTYDEPPAETVYAVLEVRRPGESEPFYSIPLRRRAPGTPYESARLLESTLCGPRPPVLEPEAEYCATLTVFDGAGNRAGGDQEVCNAVAACAERELPCMLEVCVPAASDGCGCGATRPRASWGLLGLVLVGSSLVRRGRARARRRCVLPGPATASARPGR